VNNLQFIISDRAMTDNNDTSRGVSIVTLQHFKISKSLQSTLYINILYVIYSYAIDVFKVYSVQSRRVCPRTFYIGALVY